MRSIREKLQSQSCLEREGIKIRILFKTNREREGGRETCVLPEREKRFSTFDAISIIPIRNSLFARFVSTIERRKNSIITVPWKFITRVNACVSTSVTKSRDNGIFMIPFMILTLRHIYIPFRIRYFELFEESSLSYNDDGVQYRIHLTNLKKNNVEININSKIIAV